MQLNTANTTQDSATNSGGADLSTQNRHGRQQGSKYQNNLSQAEQIIGYKFANLSLLEEALTHPSLKRVESNIKHYQRLEFLGDKVLGLVIAQFLYENLPNQDEGILSKKQALLVSGNVCYQVANELGLEKFLMMSTSQDKDGGRHNKRIVQNIMESVIGAIYEDCKDLNIVANFILRAWGQNLKMSQKDLDLKDPKTTLQEWYQQTTKSVPDYKTEIFSNANSTYFEVSLVIKNVGEVRAVDTNRKTATKLVAAKMITLLKSKGLL